MAGPAVQSKIPMILASWRLKKYGWTGDIPAMYKQIEIDKKDQLFQRMVTRLFPGEKLKTYAMTTVVFGASSSPYQAQACLMDLAEKTIKTAPDIAEIIEKHSLMDDIVYGADDVYGVQYQTAGVMSVLDAGGFPLGKFASNNKGALANIPDHLKKVGEGVVEVKTLGVWWDLEEDTMTYKIEKDDSLIDTKVQLLSKAAKIYDPLGFLTPVLLRVRKLIQKMWKETEKMNWKEKLPSEIQTEFNNYKKEIKGLNNLRVPRWIGASENSEITLIGFSDASKQAYGFCIYIKVEANVNLMRAGCRVTKMHETRTLPKLELEGAVLLAKAMKEVKLMFGEQVIKVIGYTDNQAVLSWIQGKKYGGQAFVRRRVPEIVEIIAGNDWSYVRTDQNPADKVTREESPALRSV